MHKQISHAIVGCGMVGGSVAKLFLARQNSQRSGTKLQLKYIVDKDFERAITLGLPEELFTSEFHKILNDPEVKTIIELVGGVDIARELITQSLKAGKHVITANKALLAHHGQELYALARENNVCMAFEASCGGGIPVIRALCDGLVANSIDAMFGIVNGTCNYILSKMLMEGQTYQQALSQAQTEGFAEVDPSLDVNGTDSAHKIAIMANLAFGETICFDKIPVTGISNLRQEDLAFGAKMGYTVKLIASAVRTLAGSSLRVGPFLIAHRHPLAWVSGVFNAISIYGDSVGHTMYYGRGAGGVPTASAVFADAISIANGSWPAIFNSLRTFVDTSPPSRQVAPEEMSYHYYMRIQLKDCPGLLSRITSILAKNNISIKSLVQHGESGENLAETGLPLVIITHRVKVGDLNRALSVIMTVPGVFQDHRVLPILDEHPEFPDTRDATLLT